MKPLVPGAGRGWFYRFLVGPPQVGTTAALAFRAVILEAECTELEIAL